MGIIRKDLLLAAACLLFQPSIWARPAIVVSPESKVWLEGNSTLHAFSSTATQIQAYARLSTSARINSQDFFDAVKDSDLQAFEFSIPAAGLKSGKSGLDKNMMEALKAAKVPAITFRMTGYELSPSRDKGTFQIKASGTLSVAGQERDILLNAVGKPREGGAEISGDQELLMTDFGIKPPALFLGTLKTDNKIIVRYRLKLALEEIK